MEIILSMLCVVFVITPRGQTLQDRLWSKGIWKPKPPPQVRNNLKLNLPWRAKDSGSRFKDNWNSYPIGRFQIKGSGRFNSGKLQLSVSVEPVDGILPGPSTTTTPGVTSPTPTGGSAAPVPSTGSNAAPTAGPSSPASGPTTAGASVPVIPTTAAGTQPVGSTTLGTTNPSSGAPTTAATMNAVSTTSAVTPPTSPSGGPKITTPGAATTSLGATSGPTSLPTAATPATPAGAATKGPVATTNPAATSSSPVAISSGPTSLPPSATSAGAATSVPGGTSGPVITTTVPGVTSGSSQTSATPTIVFGAPTSSPGGVTTSAVRTTGVPKTPSSESSVPTSNPVTGGAVGSTMATATGSPSLAAQSYLPTTLPPPGQICQIPVKMGVLATIINEILKSHNERRRTHGSADLVLDDHMSCDAMKFAKTIAQKRHLEHQSTQILASKGLGENIGMSCAPARNGGLSSSKIIKMARNVAKRWYDEVCQYHFERPSFAPGTGHFTELVWSGTKKLGVGIEVGKNNKFPGYDCVYVVGRYSPAGNNIGGDRMRQNVKRGSFSNKYCQLIKRQQTFLRNQPWDKRSKTKRKSRKLKLLKRRLRPFHRHHGQIHHKL